MRRGGCLPQESRDYADARDEVFRQLRLIRPRLLLANGLTLAEEAARRVASLKGSSARARPPAREVEPTASSDSWALRRLKPISAGQAYGSCYHEGSCMEAACACFNKKTYCDDSCACDSKCELLLPLAH